MLCSRPDEAKILPHMVHKPLELRPNRETGEGFLMLLSGCSICITVPMSRLSQSWRRLHPCRDLPPLISTTPASTRAWTVTHFHEEEQLTEAYKRRSHDHEHPVMRRLL